MISLLKKALTPSPSLNPRDKKEKFIREFLADPNHAWIAEDKTMARGMGELLHSLKDKHVEFFLKHPTYFIPCQAQLSCAIGRTKNHHLILVFPELRLLLKSASIYHGLSVLAHELGHIYYQHTENRIDTLQAQIEADDFAYELGFGEELQDILLEHVHSIDCRVRISKLTSKLVSKHNS